VKIQSVSRHEQLDDGAVPGGHAAGFHAQFASADDSRKRAAPCRRAFVSIRDKPDDAKRPPREVVSRRNMNRDLRST
jgi:hypothetical protein